ncbi:hypothetical protein AC1031_018890 [Aphanomyces cochlioides]|nr:hypothetical protein AC1031_018890 [Aphanomyces cochlioides]
MNEAAVVSNIELARCHSLGLNGVIQLILSQKWTVVVASNMVHYNSDKMHALQPYEVHSRIAYWDDSWQYFTHRFVCPDTGKLLVEGELSFSSLLYRVCSCESNHDQGSQSPDGSV